MKFICNWQNKWHDLWYVLFLGSAHFSSNTVMAPFAGTIGLLKKKLFEEASTLVPPIGLE